MCVSSLALSEAHDGLDVVGVDDVVADASLVLVALVRERKEHGSAFELWNERRTFNKGLKLVSHRLLVQQIPSL